MHSYNIHPHTNEQVDDECLGKVQDEGAMLTARTPDTLPDNWDSCVRALHAQSSQRRGGGGKNTSGGPRAAAVRKTASSHAGPLPNPPLPSCTHTLNLPILPHRNSTADLPK
jgi:hypothetical protein